MKEISSSIKRKVLDDIKAVPIIAKHISKVGEHIGSQSLYFAPICIWNKSIEIKVDIRRDVFKKALAEFVERNSNCVSGARFIYNGDSCPYIWIGLKED